MNGFVPIELWIGIILFTLIEKHNIFYSFLKPIFSLFNLIYVFIFKNTYILNSKNQYFLINLLPVCIWFLFTNLYIIINNKICFINFYILFFIL